MTFSAVVQAPRTIPYIQSADTNTQISEEHVCSYVSSTLPGTLLSKHLLNDVGKMEKSECCEE